MDKSEATVEQVSVLPFIDALGYDSQNPAEVRKQFAILNWDAVDFAILRNSEPMIVLEAKKASETLTKHWKQLFQYFNADKARIGILTNGIEYRFYTDGVKQNIMDDEPSLIINLVDLDKVSVAQLDDFTRARFHPEHSLRKIKISNLLARELRQPTDEFVRYFAKQIHSGTVWQNVINEFRPLVKQCLDEIVEQKITDRIPPNPDIDGGDNDPEPDASDVVEIPVFAEYKGHRFEATLLVDEIMNWYRSPIIVRFEGKEMSHVAAMFRAIRSINPERKTGRNGLRFWQFSHPNSGEDLPIKVICDDVQKGGPLRQQLLDNAKN